MKFLVFMPANEDSEAGKLPPEEGFEAMMKFNAELAEAGVLLAAEGLAPTSQAAKLRYDDAERRTVIDGPFAEAKELVAGFWMAQGSSLEEVIERFKRAPIQGVTVQIRPIMEPEDLGPTFTPALREAQEQLRAKMVQH
jgi:hypothetical protein